MNRYSEAAEQQSVALQGLKKAIGYPHLRPGASDQEMINWIDDQTVLTRATPFYWSKSCVRAVRTLMPDFNLDQVVCDRELLPLDLAWHWFEEPLFHIVAHGSKQLLPVVAISWAYCTSRTDPRTMIAATAWCNCPELGQFTPLPTLWRSSLEGKMLSNLPNPEFGFDDVAYVESSTIGQFVACAGTFLRQKLLRIEQMSLERHTRKRLAKTGQRVPSTVSVVYMRRLESHNGPSAPSNGEALEHDFQWTVRGHIRQQWYPSLQKNLPVYIHPHLKGPEDKPLKPRSTPIIAVVR